MGVFQIREHHAEIVKLGRYGMISGNPEEVFECSKNGMSAPYLQN